MSPQQPRRPASSRGGTQRPRKIAGRTPEPEQPVDETAAPAASTPSAPTAPTATTAATAAPEVAPKADSSPATEPAASWTSLFAGARLTRGLLVVLAVLVVLLVLQGAWFLQHKLREPKSTPQDALGQVVVPPGRPVVMNQSDVDQGVDEAAKDAVLLIKRDYRTYDADVAKGVDVLTSRFAPQFKATTSDVKHDFITAKTSVDAKVVAQGVVRANDTQLQALLFLDQYVTKGTGKQRRLTYTPYKVLVTMVHTDHGWLVDHLDTQ
ncbi:MAG TPA: hypothetical protein VJ872_05495 [Nocardioides sp.]|nr:hypothetical protein [Nocardioides sp.]